MTVYEITDSQLAELTSGDGNATSDVPGVRWNHILDKSVAS